MFLSGSLFRNCKVSILNYTRTNAAEGGVNQYARDNTHAKLMKRLKYFGELLCGTKGKWVVEKTSKPNTRVYISLASVKTSDAGSRERAF